MNEKQGKRHNIYLDDELWAEAVTKAQQMGVSVSFVVREILKLFVEDRIKIDVKITEE